MEPAAARHAMEFGAASSGIGAISNRSLSAMEPSAVRDVNSSVVDDHAGITVDAGVESHLERPSTPQHLTTSVSCTSDTINTNSKEHLKPKIGMIFDTLKDVEEFYKSYAHEVGFSVRVGQHKKGNEEILFKRYYCSREGYKKENITNASDESGKNGKTHNVMETRCGCQAYIVVKLGSDKKYQIVSMVEQHSHGFVSPDKRHLLRSNRKLRAEKQNEVPSNYIMKRWEIKCKRSAPFFDEEGNVLDEKPKDPMEVAMRKKISDSRNKFEDLIQMTKSSEQGMDFLYSSLSNLVEPLQQITPAMRVDKHDEYESFLGNEIPSEVDIHPPNDIRSKERSKRMRKSKEKVKKKKVSKMQASSGS